MRYLDPKNDLTFKKIFGEHPDLLLSLLNALLPLSPNNYVESLEYLPSEQVPTIPEFKNSIVDVRCTDRFGRQFIVEMQMLWTPSFKARILFNASKAFIKQLQKGKPYESLQPVYALTLLNDEFVPEHAEFYHHYSIVNVENPEMKLEGLEFVFIELPKFKPQSISEQKMAVLWLRFLTEIEDGEDNVSDDFMTNEETKKALEILQESAFTKEELEVYDRYWDSVSTERTYAIEKARLASEKGREEGREKGLEEGRKQGLEEGLELGMAKGLEQGVEQGEKIGAIKEKENIVVNGFRAGIPIETLAVLTGFSPEQVNAVLQNEGLV